MAEKKLSLADWQTSLKSSETAKELPTAQAADSNLVYSTTTGRITEPKSQKASGEAFADGVVRIRRETKGRGGKAVLTITGIAESHEKLADIAARLKKHCACGGSVKDGIIEIQGDKRQQVEQLLQQLGYKTKWAGG